MTIMIEIPPEDTVPLEVMAYLVRMLQNIQNEIDAVNSVAIRTVIPDNPKEGRIYYLSEFYQDEISIAEEGYYVYLNGDWHSMDLTKL